MELKKIYFFIFVTMFYKNVTIKTNYNNILFLKNIFVTLVNVTNSKKYN